MDKRVEGSWLIHHTQKLGLVTSNNEYSCTEMAGKAGMLLSAISADDQADIDMIRVEALAGSANISRLELPTLLGLLEEKGVIDKSKNSISVLGTTTHSSLIHTSNFFRDFNPRPIELAAIELSELASDKPIDKKEAFQYFSDTYRLDTPSTKRFFETSEIIGFIDSEKYGRDKEIYFNGNVFRSGSPKKIKSVLDTLSPIDNQNLLSINGELKKTACMSVIEVRKVLGVPLFDKLCAVGYFDINVVSNSQTDYGYVTLPSTFSKYSSSMVDDAFDLAKAFVSSLTYGMTRSEYPRGKISMINRLLQVLISGEPVGPVNAIGEDYKVLEAKGVIRVFSGSKKGRRGYMMKLLKREVGELALQAINQGDISENSLECMPGMALTRYKGPSANRVEIRKQQLSRDPKATNDVIQALRTGAIF